MHDWDVVWEQWDEDCCDSAVDSGNFEFELQKENRKRHHREEKGQQQRKVKKKVILS